MSDFPKYPKTNRLYDDILITEKLDGTNGLIQIKLLEGEQNPAHYEYQPAAGESIVLHADGLQYSVRAGSRERWLVPGKNTDNYGFAAWVEENADTLVLLGEGVHYGEWWGAGIQRKYGMATKRFSLFNTFHLEAQAASAEISNAYKPPVESVPVLYRGPFSEAAIKEAERRLILGGSVAAPGFMRPKGIIVRFLRAKVNLKVVLDGGEGKRNG